MTAQGQVSITVYAAYSSIESSAAIRMITCLRSTQAEPTKEK